MILSEALSQLRQAHDAELALLIEPMVITLPTPAEVDETQASMAVLFHSDYRRFLLEASDVVAGTIRTAVVTPRDNYRSITEMVSTAWRLVDLPRDLFPICEDNADYFCMASSGQSSQVSYWSHNGTTDESWPDLATWIMEVWLKKN